MKKENELKVQIFARPLTSRTTTYRPHSVLSLPESEAKELIRTGGATLFDDASARSVVETATQAPGSSRNLSEASLEEKGKSKRAKAKEIKEIPQTKKGKK